jgi:hypothetical protein
LVLSPASWLLPPTSMVSCVSNACCPASIMYGQRIGLPQLSTSHLCMNLSTMLAHQIFRIAQNRIRIY